MRTFLLIDGHNFSYRSLYVIPKPRSGKYLDKKQDREIFRQQLVSQLLNLLNAWRTVADGVVFAWDYGSWRKELLKKEFDGEVEYKATRNTEEKVNMKAFADTIGEFKEWLRKCRVEQCELYGAEGDDWICALARRLNGRGDKAIIYSNDGDLNQLVVDGVMQLAKNGEKYSFYVSPADYGKLTRNDPVNVLDVMLNGGMRGMDTLKMTVNEMVAGKRLELVPVNAQESLFRKIMTGDKSDNIPSVCRVSKNGRTYGISEKMSDRILSDFYSRSGLDSINESCYENPELSGMLCEGILAVAKDRLKYEGDASAIVHALERNIRYVMLGNATTPAAISDAMSMRMDVLLADGGYINWSAIDEWREKNPSATKKVEVNGLNSILGREDKDTDWSFIRKDEGGKLF